MASKKEKNSFTEPPVFLQTRATTCGVSCLMMVLGALKGHELNSQIEGKIRKQLKMKGYDLVPAISLAEYLKKQGLEVEAYHQNSGLFWQHIRDSFPDRECCRVPRHPRRQ